MFLDDQAIERVRREAEPEEPELGWEAVVEATAERRTRKDTAQSAAGNIELDVDAVYATARQREVGAELLEDQRIHASSLQRKPFGGGP